MDTSIDEIVKRYALAVTQRYSPKAIYLYGSYAHGNARNDSDIDIAVIFGPINNDEYIDIFSGLSNIASKIDYNIEPNLIIDDGNYSKYSFLAEVMETGLIIKV